MLPALLYATSGVIVIDKVSVALSFSLQTSQYLAWFASRRVGGRR